MARIAILYGGRSGEHEVSRTSAASVLRNLAPHHEPILIGIDRNGTWYLQDLPEAGSESESLDIRIDDGLRCSILPGSGIIGPDGRKLAVDAVLPILHGSYGEDGTMQGLLEIARVAYAGSGVLGSSVCMDKEMSKRIWREAGLPVVPWRTLISGRDDPESPALAEAVFKDLGTPLFVKPANAGSSVGVSKVKNAAELTEAIRTAWRHDKKALVEKAISGREIECSVMGYEAPWAFPPGEVIPAGNHGFYDYDAKYVDPDGALLSVPADLEEDTAKGIRSIAVQAYRTVEAGGLARVDFLLDTVSGEIFINEINTLPGMTRISLFPRMTAAEGLGFTDMLERLIQGALEQASYRDGLSYDH
ncbi:MAG: D-alanine--D-alanine ligase [Spirochaetaceae bacterium]|nr:D-alanine--D-alanine ligase [Spirochaetaceae bacterium]